MASPSTASQTWYDGAKPPGSSKVPCRVHASFYILGSRHADADCDHSRHGKSISTSTNMGSNCVSVFPLFLVAVASVFPRILRRIPVSTALTLGGSGCSGAEVSSRAEECLVFQSSGATQHNREPLEQYNQEANNGAGAGTASRKTSRMAFRDGIREGFAFGFSESILGGLPGRLPGKLAGELLEMLPGWPSEKASREASRKASRTPSRKACRKASQTSFPEGFRAALRNGFRRG